MQNFDILVRAFYVIILIVQQNYFPDLYPAKILDFSAKSFFAELLYARSCYGACESCETSNRVFASTRQRARNFESFRFPEVPQFRCRFGRRRRLFYRVSQNKLLWT